VGGGKERSTAVSDKIQKGGGFFNNGKRRKRKRRREFVKRSTEEMKKECRRGNRASWGESSPEGEQGWGKCAKVETRK